MTNNDPQGKRFPFRLCEVLEQEYVSLHQQQTWQADWLLHPGDVAVAKLTQRLRDAAHDLPMSPAHAIRQRLADTELDLAAEPDFAFEQRLLDALNALLRAERLLYDPGWLQPDSEAYRLSALRADEANEDSRPAMSDAAQQGASEHAQLNRLLLEAAFGPDLVARVDATRLTRLFERVHRLPPSGIMRSALCLSGGGIRSASFGVGALQALAAHGVLDKFDYLSTVSGGGYVGSWLSTWIYRHPQRLAGVTQALRASTQHEGSQWESKIEPEPDPIRFLRSYSHFLNPKAGVFTLDTWAWIGLYLRNLTLNWLIIIPLLLLLLLAPRVFAALAAVFAARSEPVDPWLFWCATLAGISVVLCAILNRPSATDPARRARQMPAVRPSQPRAVDKLLDRIKQPHWILALGVAPLLLFSTILALLVWGLPAGKTQLPLDALVRWIVTVPLFDLPSVLPVILLDNILVWGEGIILVAWLLSLALLPSGPWRMRVQELGAMLLAGALTWLIVSRLSIAFIGSTGDSARPMLSGTIYPLHLYAMLGVPGVVLAILAGMTLFIGIVSKKKWIDDEDREWWARFGAWILVATLSWVVLSAITLLGPLLLFEWPRLLGALGGLSGLAAVLLGKSALTPGPKSAGVESHNKLLAALGVNTTALLAALFLAVFLAALSLLTSGLLIALRASTSAWWTASAACAGQPVLSDAWQVLARAQVHTEVVCQTPLLDLLIALAVLAAIALIAAFNINLNKFSLHAAYRIRIARTFLGASRGANRKPNPFTGFDPLDNVPMHALQPGLLREIDIVDLKGVVTQLRDALVKQASSPQVAALAHMLCSPRHDRYGLLQARLRSFEDADPVLGSLQRELVEHLNRVLESERLDRCEAFRVFLDRDAAASVRNYIEHGNLVFANRKLLELAFPDALPKFDFPPPPPHKLMHVINLTLNLVHGRQLAWQERKAAPFAVTPMYAGNYYLGYRESRNYGDGVSIATAAAISGAAVSPNMGYSSSPLTTLLLTLFNVRLGWWLGNPGSAGALTYRRREPRLSVRPVLSEALGMTDDQSPYVYLSDGGHFENLGLFEMVLRRCHLMVVFDAGADPGYRFDDLGNAVRKVRIDLGIPIEFETLPMRKRGGGDDGSIRYCTLGRVRYAAVDGADAPDGLLLYFKPVLCGGEPADVLHYASENTDFPQEPTTDQFFGEAQFESYRRLGQFAVDTALNGVYCEGRTWAADLVQGVRRYLKESAASPWIDAWLALSSQGKP